MNTAISSSNIDASYLKEIGGKLSTPIFQCQTGPHIALVYATNESTQTSLNIGVLFSQGVFTATKRYEDLELLEEIYEYNEGVRGLEEANIYGTVSASEFFSSL